jgi:hypothetical protein
LFAKLQVVIDGFMERLLHFFNALPLERDGVPQTEHLSMEDPRLIIIFHMARISFIFQRDVTLPTECQLLSRSASLT